MSFVSFTYHHWIYQCIAFCLSNMNYFKCFITSSLITTPFNSLIDYGRKSIPIVLAPFKYIELSFGGPRHDGALLLYVPRQLYVSG